MRGGKGVQGATRWVRGCTGLHGAVGAARSCAAAVGGRCGGRQCAGSGRAVEEGGRTSMLLARARSIALSWMRCAPEVTWLGLGLGLGVGVG